MTNPRLEAVARAIVKEALRLDDSLALTEREAKHLAQAALATIEPELEAMREALAFYANDEHYSSNGFTGKSMIVADYGHRARAARAKDQSNDHP